MLFNSLEFLFFFPVVTALYFALRWRLRIYMLLAASTLFYMAFVPRYIAIIYFTIVVDYIAGLLIARSSGARRKAFLVVSLIVNIGALAVFKYWNFASNNIDFVLQHLGSSSAVPRLDIILPVGLSFHTFQAMSYTIEVYRGKQEPERDFSIYALYVLYYPQLVAGPIERPQNVLPQLRIEHRFDADRVTRGFRRMLWGFFKKVVVADRLAKVVNAVYGSPHAHGGPALVIATIFFAFQIYADFSGYSDVALGASEVMGVRLMTNFREPYTSTSVREFWSRWHISLSTWFRDYVYIPLGGNRCGPIRRRANLLVTFLLSGLWHGASWTYVVWGGLNGIFLVAERGDARTVAKRRSLLRLGSTFALVTFSWIFFRAATLSDALYIVTRLPTRWGAVLHPGWFTSFFTATAGAPSSFGLTVIALATLIGADVWARFRESDPVDRLASASMRVRWFAYYALAFAICAFGQYGHQQFIYFQF